MKASANGYLLEVNGYSLHASWAAPFFALILDDPEAENYDPEPLLFHCETLECARRHVKIGGGRVLDSTFQGLAA